MQTLTLLVSVLTAQPARPPDFDTEVVPVLTRAGCNAGSCHGAAAGRGGFHLSLWGSDPAADHDTLTRELEGRRVNLARPARSLLLLKPTGEVRHGGGRKLVPDGAGAARILAWIEAGAPRTPGRTLKQLVVSPSESLLSRPGETVELRVRATFDDDITDDVTPWAVFSTSDPDAVELGPGGVARVRRPGSHVVLARFLDRIVPVRLVLPAGEKAVDLSTAERRNFIDDEVLETLATLRLPPAPLCDDATFLRRVRLDLTGTLPTPEEMRDFLADRMPDRRERLVDRLLTSPEFVDLWAMKWAQLLRIQSRSLGKDGAKSYHDWVRTQLADGVPLDRMTREMLVALGDTTRVPAANFARAAGDARAQAELVGRAFLGVRLQCANCHNHPLDRWTQDDYHGLAATFARLERGPVVRLGSRGEVIHPRTGEPARPRLPGVRFVDAEGDPRKKLADWLTSADNPLFARTIVNRLWREMLGRGLVEPADDLRATNPATHPRLLDRLADDLVKHRYDLRRTLRLIATSATYQRESGSDPLGETFYARAAVRPLPPEVLADAIVAVTGVADRHGDLPPGTRAVALFDSLIPSPTLDVLGRCSRTGPCEDEADTGGLARTLHLINGPLLNAKIGDAKGRLRRLLDQGRSAEDIVAELHLRALGREPDAAWRKKFANLTGDARRETLEDFLWALLTCKDFTTNH